MDTLLHEDDERLLAAALNLGEQLLECGGEISRVEDTIRRICLSYGASRTDVFAITSSIVVTMERGGRSATQTRRISGGQTDFARLEDLNALSRTICADHPPIEEIEKKLKENPKKAGSLPLSILGYVLASGAFTLFFGGAWSDALCAAAISVLVLFQDRYARPYWPSTLLYLFFCSAASGLLAFLCAQLGLCANSSQVMIGDIMLLIPGISLTNALRDLFMGDTISGMLRLMESLLQAGVIACGFAVAVYLEGVIG